MTDVLVTGSAVPAGTLRAARRIAAVCLAMPLVIAAAMYLGAQPVPAKAVGGVELVQIAIVDNGFHTDIALPAMGDTLERLGLRADHYPVDRGAVRWWGVGWGSQTAYTSLDAVSDLSLGIIARSVAFDRSVMHVAPWGSIEGEAGVRLIEVSREDYDTLLRSIERFFASTTPLSGITQGYGDRFYRANGRFTAWFGCNAWVGRRLREAGVGVGLWTPTAQSVGYGLDRITGGTHE